jgi:hypothetical protein
LPAVFGLKLTVTPHVAPAASGATQVEPTIVNALGTVTVGAPDALPPTLVTVKVAEPLVVPTSASPKSYEVGLIARAAGATPVPASEAVAAPPGLPEIVTAAVRAPGAVGLNFTPNVQVAPGASFAPQPAVSVNAAASGPDSARVSAPVSVDHRAEVGGARCDRQIRRHRLLDFLRDIPTARGGEQTRQRHDRTKAHAAVICRRAIGINVAAVTTSRLSPSRCAGARR